MCQEAAARSPAALPSGLAGERIISLQLRTSSSSSAQFQYDNILLINYNTNVLLASDRRVAGSTGCSVPPTETVGTLNVNIPDFEAPAAAASTCQR